MAASPAESAVIQGIPPEPAGSTGPTAFTAFGSGGPENCRWTS